MFRVTRTTVRTTMDRAGQTAQRVVTTVRTQPSWVTKAAFVAGSLTLLAVILLLVIPAVAIALVVFLFAAAAVSLKRAVFGLLRPRSGELARKNVRVIAPRSEV